MLKFLSAKSKSPKNSYSNAIKSEWHSEPCQTPKMELSTNNFFQSPVKDRWWSYFLAIVSRVNDILRTTYRSSRQELFCKNGVLRNSTKIRRKTPVSESHFNKVVGLRPATLLKRRLLHRCFPVNFLKFLRTPFCIEQLWWLLLNQLVCFVFLYDKVTNKIPAKNFTIFQYISKYFSHFQVRRSTCWSLRHI